MRITVTISLVLIAISVDSRSTPLNQYNFSAPNFEELLPFSESELKKFDTEQVQKVELAVGGYRTLHHLDENGRVTLTEEFEGSLSPKRIKERQISTTTYSYNSNGQLIVKRRTGMYDRALDSIAYNKTGLVKSYFASWTSLVGKKKHHWTDVYYDLRLKESTENGAVLVDHSSSGPIFYHFNKSNVCHKVLSDFRNDSLSISSHLDTTVLEFWYSKLDTLGWRLGERQLSINGHLTKAQFWATNSGKVIQTELLNYVYNKYELLQRIENDQPYKDIQFFTYYSSGLLYSRIHRNRHRGLIEETVYNYHY